MDLSAFFINIFKSLIELLLIKTGKIKMKTKIKKLIEKCINEYGLIVNIGYKFNNVFRHHLDIKSWLAKNYTNIPLVEALYMIHYNLKERPKCKYCNKNEVRFINFIDGYKKCCCAECTNMLKYGAKNISQLPEIKEKMLSTFKTNYGSLGRKNPIIDARKTPSKTTD